MHIVIDARSRPSSTGRYIDRLLEHLQQIDQKNSYTVLIRPNDSWQPKTKNFSALTCPFQQFSFNPLDQISFSLWLRRLKADVVHFGMTPQEPLFYLGNRVTTTHDLSMLRFTRAGKLPLPVHWLRMFGYRILIRYSLRRAKAIITPTTYVAKDVGTSYPFTVKKITVTHEASEPPLNVEPKKPNDLQRPFILYVGSAFPHKNLPAVVDAFSILAKKHKDLHLVLTGKKEYYYQQLEEYAKNSDASERIIFTGFVSDSELKWLYKNAEAYVFPSLSEGFGLPGLEAMVHGCPVTSSNATCLPEVYGDAAVYFDPKDPTEITDKVDGLLTNPTLRKQLITRGFVQAKKFSWHRMAKQTLAVYQQVLRQK